MRNRPIGDGHRSEGPGGHPGRQTRAPRCRNCVLAADPWPVMPARIDFGPSAALRWPLSISHRGCPAW
jgi:hypothetical protein